MRIYENQKKIRKINKLKKDRTNNELRDKLKCFTTIQDILPFFERFYIKNFDFFSPSLHIYLLFYWLMKFNVLYQQWNTTQNISHAWSFQLQNQLDPFRIQCVYFCKIVMKSEPIRLKKSPATSRFLILLLFENINFLLSHQRVLLDSKWDIWQVLRRKDFCPFQFWFFIGKSLKFNTLRRNYWIMYIVRMKLMRMKK